jgi:hypothetical protein
MLACPVLIKAKALSYRFLPLTPTLSRKGRGSISVRVRRIYFKKPHRACPPVGRGSLVGRPHLCAEALRCAGTVGRPYMLTDQG